MVQKMRYDQNLEQLIEEAKQKGDFKSVFVLQIELNNWNGVKL